MSISTEFVQKVGNVAETQLSVVPLFRWVEII
nr:MAG TPA: hypothetical protein [Bacteriophage sp.]